MPSQLVPHHAGEPLAPARRAGVSAAAWYRHRRDVEDPGHRPCRVQCQAQGLPSVRTRGIEPHGERSAGAGGSVRAGWVRSRAVSRMAGKNRGENNGLHEISSQDQLPSMRSSHQSRDRLAGWLRLLETSLHRTRDEQVHLRGARESGLRSIRRYRCGKSVASQLKLIRRSVCSEHPTRASRLSTTLTQLRTDRPSWCTRKEPISDSMACIV